MCPSRRSTYTAKAKVVRNATVTGSTICIRRKAGLYWAVGLWADCHSLSSGHGFVVEVTSCGRLSVTGLVVAASRNWGRLEDVTFRPSLLGDEEGHKRAERPCPSGLAQAKGEKLESRSSGSPLWAVWVFSSSLLGLVTAVAPDAAALRTIFERITWRKQLV